MAAAHDSRGADHASSGSGDVNSGDDDAWLSRVRLLSPTEVFNIGLAGGGGTLFVDTRRHGGRSDAAALSAGAGAAVADGVDGTVTPVSRRTTLPDAVHVPPPPHHDGDCAAAALTFPGNVDDAADAVMPGDATVARRALKRRSTMTVVVLGPCASTVARLPQDDDVGGRGDDDTGGDAAMARHDVAWARHVLRLLTAERHEASECIRGAAPASTPAPGPSRAAVLAAGPVCAVAGGYEAFEAAFPFVATRSVPHSTYYPSHITDALFLGSARHAMSQHVIEDLGITHVVNATNRQAGTVDTWAESHGVKYTYVDVVDVDGQDIAAYFDDVYAFVAPVLKHGHAEAPALGAGAITSGSGSGSGSEDGSGDGAVVSAATDLTDDNTGAARVSGHLSTKRAGQPRAGRPRVLIHCRQGVSRSATLVMYCLMRGHGMTLADAYAHVFKCREVVCPNLSFREQLLTAEVELRGEPSVTPFALARLGLPAFTVDRMPAFGMDDSRKKGGGGGRCVVQ